MKQNYFLYWNYYLL